MPSMDEVLRSLPVFTPYREHGALRLWDDCRLVDDIYGDQPFALGVTLRHAPHNGSRTAQVPVEEVEILSRDACGYRRTGITLSGPICKLLNLVDAELDFRIAEDQGPIDSECKLKDALDSACSGKAGLMPYFAWPQSKRPSGDCMRAGGSEVARLFFLLGHVPYPVIGEGFPYTYVAESLCDIAFGTLMPPSSLWPNSPVIRRCECAHCGKIFFAKQKNRRYCYFPAPSIYHDAFPSSQFSSCSNLLKNRAAYEECEEKKRAARGEPTLKDLKYKMRNRYNRRVECSSSDFTDRYSQFAQQLSGDPLRYEKLYKWALHESENDKFGNA